MRLQGGLDNLTADIDVLHLKSKRLSISSLKILSEGGCSAQAMLNTFEYMLLVEYTSSPMRINRLRCWKY